MDTEIEGRKRKQISQVSQNKEMGKKKTVKRKKDGKWEIEEKFSIFFKSNLSF